MDLNMPVLFGPREPTATEYDAVLDEAGSTSDTVACAVTCAA